MDVKAGLSSISSVFTSPSPYFIPRRVSQLSLSKGPYVSLQYDARKLRSTKVNSLIFIDHLLQSKQEFIRRQVLVSSSSKDPYQESDLEPDVEEGDLEPDVEEGENLSAEDEILSPTISPSDISVSDGKSGFVSFYNRQYKSEDETSRIALAKSQSSLLWFVGPAVLVASFIFPSLYLRRLLSIVFEDSLLTDFLILFFTEALFYCGVAIFLLLIDRLRRPLIPELVATDHDMLGPQLGQRISSVATLALSLIIPMVTMGLVWPWTGPAASATLAPYLVGIVVQFAFEQYARSRKSPAWPIIPIVFQIYRLHQLNRAAQLVTALSFTVRGAEMTSHNIEISNSLGTLLNVLQLLGVICIWSLSSFLMKYFPSHPKTA